MTYHVFVVGDFLDGVLLCAAALVHLPLHLLIDPLGIGLLLLLQNESRMSADAGKRTARGGRGVRESARTAFSTSVRKALMKAL